MPAFVDTFTDSSFTYSTGACFVRAKWPGPVSETALRTHYTKLLGLALAQGGNCYWLLDLRGYMRYLPSFERWFDTVFAETAHAALGQPLHIAYVLGRAHYAFITTQGTPAAQRGCIRHQVYFSVFESKAEALVWLARQRAYQVGQGPRTAGGA